MTLPGNYSVLITGYLIISYSFYVPQINKLVLVSLLVAFCVPTSKMKLNIL